MQNLGVNKVYYGNVEVVNRKKKSYRNLHMRNLFPSLEIYIIKQLNR